MKNTFAGCSHPPVGVSAQTRRSSSGLLISTSGGPAADTDATEDVRPGAIRGGRDARKSAELGRGLASLVAGLFTAATLSAATPADLERKAELKSIEQIREVALKVAAAQAALEAEVDKFNGIVRIWQDKCRAKGGTPNVDGFTNPRCVLPQPRPQQEPQPSTPLVPPPNPTDPKTR
jgi:hypothetical protein